MVWRVDAAENPVELRGFASGTLIGDRVVLTAGHFTAPATTLRSAAVIGPHLCQLQSGRREGRQDPDSRRWLCDASIDATVSAAAAVRSH